MQTRHPALASPNQKSTSTQRRRLWQLPPKYHCPIVGVCFSVEELRPLILKASTLAASSNDYELHVSAVSACSRRTALAETLQKLLEKRFQTQIRRFSAARSRAEIAALWHESTGAGIDIPGALWAAWTHPACDEGLEQDIFRDIHMIQHQVGKATRADLATQKLLREENAELRQALEHARLSLDCLRQTRQHEQQAHAQVLAELRNALVASDARLERLEQENRQRRAPNPPSALPPVMQAHREAVIQRRLREAEARASQFSDRIAELTHALTLAERRAQANCPSSEAAPDRPHEELASLHAKTLLAGKNILCVGGRTGSIDNYKEVVERRGGRFLHHDGGVEDNLQRIDSALAAADLVICQAGCISHNAYWRVKAQCKRTGKPCVFIKTPGATSFSRLLDTVGAAAEGNTTNDTPIAFR